MTEYLIAFNDEWVQEHTEEEIVRKGRASVAVALEWPQEVHRFPARRGADGHKVTAEDG